MKLPGAGRRLSVLHVLRRLDRGGAEVRTVEAIPHFDMERFRFDFCSISDTAGALDAEVYKYGGQVHRMPLDWRLPGQLRRLFREHHYDIVHSHIHHLSGYILRLAAQAGVPVRIAHYRASNDGSPLTVRRRLQTFVAKRWIDRYATAIVGVSKAALEWNWRDQWQTDPRFSVVYNCVDISRFLAEPDRRGVLQEFGFPESSILYIHIANFWPLKNQMRLLHIFKAIHSRRPESRLLFVGDYGNSFGHSVKQASESICETGAVRFAGVRNDVPRIIQAANAMIFPSSWEGLPGAVLECAVTGLPILASSIPPVLELASHFSNITSLSLESPDTEWAERAVALVSGPRRRTEPKRTVASTPFSVEAYVSGIRNLYLTAPGTLRTC